MPSTEPPADYRGEPRSLALPAGTRLFRVHRRKRAATAFAPVVARSPFSGGRFDCLPGDEYPFFYAAFNEHTALAEVLLRGIPFDEQGFRVLPRAALDRRRLSCIETTVDLTLLSLCSGADLAAVCQDAWLIHAENTEYAKTRHWAGWLRRQAPWADGFVWPSKRDVGEQAVVLFGDRCDPDALRAAGPVVDLDGPTGEKWLNDKLADYRVVVRPSQRPPPTERTNRRPPTEDEDAMDNRDETDPAPDRTQPGEHPDPLAGESRSPAAFQDIRTALSSPLGKAVAVGPAVIALVAGFVLGQATTGRTEPAASPITATTTMNTTVNTTVSATTTVPAPASTSASKATSGSAGGTTTAPSGTGSSTGASTQPPAPDPTSVGTVTLTNLTPVLGKFTSRVTAPMINGKAVLASMTQDMGCYNPTTGDFGYDLGRNYSQLTIQLGVDDSSPISTLAPTVEIDGDGLKLGTYTPTVGHPTPVTLTMTNVLRLDFKWVDAAAACVPGTNQPAGTLVLGNGQLTTVPGYHPVLPTSTG